MIFLQRRLWNEDYLFATGVIVDQTLYYFSENENDFMEMDMNSWTINYSDKIDGYMSESSKRADMMRSYGDKIFKLGIDGKCIEEFSLGKSGCRKIVLDGFEKEWDNYTAFDVKNDFLYIFAKWKRELVKININDYKVKKWIIPVERERIHGSFIGFSASYIQKNTIWLFEFGSSRVTEYDMDENSAVFYYLPHEVKDCISICRVENTFYMLNFRGLIYVWNVNSNECRLFSNLQKYSDKEYYFEEMIAVQKQLILLPGLGTDIVIVDCATGDIRLYEDSPRDITYLDRKMGKYVNRFEDRKYYYYPMRMSEYIVRMDKESGVIDWKKPKFPSQKEKMFYLYAKNKKYPVVLTEGLKSISFFRKYIEYVEERKVKTKDMKIGNKIWGIIR